MRADALREGDVVVWRGERWTVSRPSLLGRGPLVLLHLMAGARYEVIGVRRAMELEVVR